MRHKDEKLGRPNFLENIARAIIGSGAFGKYFPGNICVGREGRQGKVSPGKLWTSKVDTCQLCDLLRLPGHKCGPGHIFARAKIYSGKHGDRPTPRGKNMARAIFLSATMQGALAFVL